MSKYDDKRWVHMAAIDEAVGLLTIQAKRAYITVRDRDDLEQILVDRFLTPIQDLIKSLPGSNEMFCDAYPCPQPYHCCNGRYCSIWCPPFDACEHGGMGCCP